MCRGTQRAGRLSGLRINVQNQAAAKPFSVTGGWSMCRGPPDNFQIQGYPKASIGDALNTLNEHIPRR